ncbi:MAG: flagellar basal body rod protein FlgG, partial [Clostridiales bacterium GWC2_40_7]
AQQFNVDVISNNLSNVNTTGFKKERVEFKDLLYQTMERAYVLEDQGKPVNLQVGFGVMPVATVKNFDTGNFEQTDNPLDLAIDGEGFFMVLGPTGNIQYTRDGSFKISITEEGSKITTSDGFPLLDDTGNEIILNIDVSSMNISSSGELSYTDELGLVVSLGQTIGVMKFPNKFGLESTGRNLYAENSASGFAVSDAELGTRSIINQGFLEASNVQTVEEMVKLIVAQRAYEINSKAIQSADEMLGMANNLKR